jgi:hypothetical protein
MAALALAGGALLWHHWRFVTGRPVVEDGPVP